MTTTTFTEISARYEKDSIIQKSAAERLLSLLDIQRWEAVLDLGCGTGSLTRRIRGLTDAPITGVDPSIGMIEAAQNAPDTTDIAYIHSRAEDVAFTGTFNVIFCNSAFQWFEQPDQALAASFAALRSGGRIGIQAPARLDYCPNFLRAIDAVAADPRTAEVFSRFTPRWLFLESTEEYRSLFERAGFRVPFATIEEQVTPYTPDQVITIFESGAAAGYLNRELYLGGYDDDYPALFREIVAASFRNQACQDGLVPLVFNRIYLIAVKP
ncbi:MAG: class I SAM-dependent methyltransferase [Desulfuromonadaceae bacterium]